MRILFLTDDDWSGGKIADEAIYKNFVKLFPEEEITSYVPKLPPKLFPPLKRIKKIICYFIKFYRYLKNRKIPIDTVLLTTSTVSILAVRFVEFKTRRQLFSKVFYIFHAERWITHHGINAPKQLTGEVLYRVYEGLFCLIFKRLQSHLFRKVLCFITFSTPSTEYLNKTYNIPFAKIHQTDLGVNHDVFKPHSARNAQQQRRLLGIRKNQRVVLFSGRFDALKGIPCLIDAVRSLRRRHNIFLIIAGIKDDNKYWKEIAAYVRKVLQNSFIIFFDLKHKTLARYYRIADCVVLPSLIESSSLILLETLACGTLFVGTQVGNIPNVLTQISKQLILKDNQPDTIANTLDTIFTQSPKTLMALKNKSLLVSQNYRWDQTTKEIYEIITA